MPWLLIDNSNTRTKFALGDASALLPWRATLATRELTPDLILATLSGTAFDAVSICSVVPEKAAVLRSTLSPLAPVAFLDQLSPLGLEIEYPNPPEIGADRLANAVGAVHLHRAPAIVIDFGTAVTFDVISSRPAYCGGVIAPGLGVMSAYLPSHTALLPAFEPAEPVSAIGKSTLAAMNAGTVIGYRGLIRGILEALMRETEPDPLLIATGGDAALIARGIPEIRVIDPDITLQGLRIVAGRVFGPAIR